MHIAVEMSPYPLAREDVFGALRAEIAVTFANPYRSVLVMKVLGGGG